MIQVDMKALLNKLNTPLTQALHNAAGLCVTRTHYEVTGEHMLAKLLEDADSDIPHILKSSGVDAGQLRAAINDAMEDFKTGNAAKPVFSPFLVELLETAWLIGSVDLQQTRIRSGAVLLAMLERPNYFVASGVQDVLEPVNAEELKKRFWELTGDSDENMAGAAPGGAGVSGGAGEAEGGAPGESFIAKFCEDFTAKAASGKIDAVFGRDAEIREMVDILARRRKNNPILVGEPGVGKTAVVEGLALRITQNDVPVTLQDVTLLGLDMGMLEAGAGMKGEFERRLKGVIDEIKGSEKPIILFIDEAHTLIGAGGSAGTSDAANLLKPALARGELKTCAATTWKEYKKYFEKDAALARRFQLVSLAEPSVAIATLILRGLRDSYEASHKVVIRDDALQMAAEFSDRYIQGRFLPDKAIDLMDTACARVKVNLSAKPAELEDTERSIQAAQRAQSAIQRDKDNGVAVDEDELAEVTTRIKDLTAKQKDLQARWKKELEAAHKVLDARTALHEAEKPTAAQKKAITTTTDALSKLQGESPMVQIEVNPDVVAQVVADWTGIPVGKVARDQAATIADLDKHLQSHIKGQDAAVEAVTAVIKAAKSGIKNPDQPLGVFLLVGPSGVGKTETGLTLADLLFGDPHAVVTVNMSEFQEKHTVSRLIGSPPGYVGYGEGGMLTEAVRHKPYSVVLLDEVEKAHPDVMNLFYQVFDKGILTDGEGKEINFKNTIIMLTSNLGTDVIEEMTGEGNEVGLEAVQSAVRPLLSQHFKPALLARMTVVPYGSLSKEALKAIATQKVEKLKGMLKQNNKMEMTYSDKVIEQIVDRCTETETGARNIDFILNGNVLPKMSQEILTHMTDDEMPSKVSVGVAKDGSFTMKFSK